MQFTQRISLASQCHGTIPPSNYLWKSPDGIAYPGWHHQLVLHLAAQKQTDWSSPTLADVKARLSQYPDYAMNDNSLQAIIREYHRLDPRTKWAYRVVKLSIPATGNQPSTDVSMEVDWESILDPALFDHRDQSSTPIRDSDSSPRPPSVSTVGTQYSNFSNNPIGTKRGVRKSPISALQSMSDRRLRQPTYRNSAPTTPTKLISVSTPSRPYPDRFRQEQYQLVSPTPRSNNPQFPIDRDIGRILFFSKGVHDSRRSTMADTIDFEAEMRLPDPTNYVQTSKKHYIIPASEAAAFVHWFQPEIDMLPDSIEGYYWYCDECYVGETTGANGGNIRGKFSHKRSIEKHQGSVHRGAWNPVLPELDRNVAVKDVEVEDVENRGSAAAETPRRRLFDGEGGPRGRGAGVNDGELGGSGGRPVTTDRRKGAEVRVDFADVNQVREPKRKK